MDIADKIRKYKKRLDAEISRQEKMDPEKVEHILKRLESQKITLSLLESTGVGKSVNSLRHHKKLGSKAKKLVSLWKNLAKSSSESSSGFGSSDSDSIPVVVEEKSKKKINKINNNNSVASSSKTKPTKNQQKVQKRDSPSAKIVHNSTEDDDTGFTNDSGMSFMDILSMSDAKKPVFNGQTSKKQTPTKTKQTTVKTAVDNHNSNTVLPESSDKFDWSGGQGKLSTSYRPGHKRKINDYLSQLAEDPVLKKPKSKTRGQLSHEIDPELFKSKHNITKVFAGRKTATTTEVARLDQICIRTICDNIDAIEDTGDIPYDILKEPLQKATPAQLMYIDERNPYLQSDTDKLWKLHCEKEFKGAQTNDKETWRQLYKRKLAEREKKLEKLATTISAKEKNNKSPQKVTQLAEAKAPRDVRRRQAKFGTHLSSSEMPKVEEVVAARRQLDSGAPRDKTGAGASASLKLSAIYRPGTNFAVWNSQEKKKPTTAPMMKKSLKMFEKAMKRR